MTTTIPLIRGVKYDFSSIELDIGNQIFTDVTAIDYSDTLTPSFLRGSRAEPIGRTRGEYEAEGSITLAKGGARDLKNLLGNGFKEAVFDATVSYSETEEGLTVDKLIGCRIISNEITNAAGPDPIVEVMSLHIMRIEWNGLDPLANMLK